MSIKESKKSVKQNRKSDNKKSEQIQDFKRFTQGMTFVQKQEYMMMSESEKTKIREKIKIQEQSILKEKEKLEKEKIEKYSKQ